MLVAFQTIDVLGRTLEDRLFRIQTIGTMVPSISYGTFTGDLFLYGSDRRLAAFESPHVAIAPSSPGPATTTSSTATISNNKKCILLGGLSDGLIPVPYTKLLEECCMEHGFTLVQPILSSSYTGFGHGTLDRDCTELVELLQHLQAHRSSSSLSNQGGNNTTNNNNNEKDEVVSEGECQFCLIGQSTGRTN